MTLDARAAALAGVAGKAKQLERNRRRGAVLRQELDVRIVDAYLKGASLRQIAAAAGVTHETVRKIVAGSPIDDALI